MNSLLSLWQSDYRGVNQWLSKNTVAKIFVIFCFLVLSSMVSLFIFGYFTVFFRGLVFYEIYGLLTAKYIVHAALLVITWLGILSAVFASTMIWNKADSKESFLNSLPLSRFTLYTYNFLPSILSSALLLCLIAGPVLLAFSLVFSHLPLSELIMLDVLILLIITLFSHVIGSVLSVILLRLSVKFGQKVWVGGVIIFGGLSYVLVKLLFPSTLRSLYFSAPGDFFKYFNQLPLVQTYLPINWLIDALLKGLDILTVVLVFLAVSGIVISMYLQSRWWTSLRSHILSQARQKLSEEIFETPIFNLIKKHAPLVYKDILSIWRVRLELSYGFFLLGMVVFFFVVLNLARGSRPFDRVEEIDQVLFALGWLWFFATAYWLRLAFPLMAREGTTRWWYLSLPISRSQLLHNKIRTGVLLSLPMVILVGILSVVWPYGIGREYVWFSLLAFLPLTVASVALGSINPDFEEGLHTEKVSTTGMGLVNLGLNGSLTACWMVLVRRSILGGNTLFALISMLFLIVVMTGVLVYFAKRQTQKMYL